MTYSEKLKDPRWQKKRLEIMARDGFKCRDCGAEKNTLHVHHCFYERGGPWDAHSDVLLTLCADCHEGRELTEEVIKRRLGKFLAARPIEQLDEYAEKGLVIIGITEATAIRDAANNTLKALV